MPYRPYKKIEDAEYAQGMPARPTFAPSGSPQVFQGPQSGASGHINFQQRFGANQGVIERDAARIAAQARKKGEAAQAALSGAQAGFGDKVKAGTLAVADSSVGTVYNPNDKPVGNTGSAATTGTSTNTGQASTTPAANSAGQALESESTRGPQLTIEEMLGRARQTYSGPQGLDRGAYASQVSAAQQDLQNLGTTGGTQAMLGKGASRFGGALTRAAGGNELQALRSRFGGIGAEADRAEAAANAQVSAAKLASGEAAKTWEAAADRQGKTNAAAIEASEKVAKTPENVFRKREREVNDGENHDIMKEDDFTRKQVLGPYLGDAQYKDSGFAAANSMFGGQYGWVYVNAPNGYIWKVPPDSREAEMYPRNEYVDEMGAGPWRADGPLLTGTGRKWDNTGWMSQEDTAASAKRKAAAGITDSPVKSGKTRSS